MGYWAFGESRDKWQYTRLAPTRNFFWQRFWRSPGWPRMAAAVCNYGGGYARTSDDGKCDKCLNCSADMPAQPNADAQCRYVTLGFRSPVQHAVSDQPFHTRQTSERRAVKPTCTFGRVFVRLAPRAKDCCDDESWVVLCRGQLASSGRSSCAIEQRSRPICWREGAIALVS